MKKKASIRAIDQGMRYDVKGNMRRFVRRVENGDLQDITDIVVVTRRITPPDGQRSIEVFHCGTGTLETAHWMMDSAKRKIENW
jgi:hypothetical protein